jgi:hypothetical protein
MPGLMRMVQTVKSSLCSGIATAVFGCSLNGRAR